MNQRVENEVPNASESEMVRQELDAKEADCAQTVAELCRNLARGLKELGMVQEFKSMLEDQLENSVKKLGMLQEVKSMLEDQETSVKKEQD